MSEPVSLAMSYREARAVFLDAANAAGAEVEAHTHPSAVGPDGCELTIDVATVGDPAAPNALLIVSGTHGVEGYAGSALQSTWLNSAQQVATGGDFKVVLLHALNPFGFAWHRRTNEDNVDLNRNFINWLSPPPGNADYAEVAELLVPDAWDEATQDESSTALLALADRYGIERLQQVITGGQYTHVAGVFYGGTGPVWSHHWLVDDLRRLFGDSERLGIIDIHTGLGPPGVGELIVHAARKNDEYFRAQQWWGEVRSMRDGESISADLNGDWLSAVPELLPDTEITSAALEFGTVDSITVLQALRAEAWMHNFGDNDSAQAADVRTATRAAFIIDEASWIASLHDRFHSVAAAAIAHLTPSGSQDCGAGETLR